MSKLRNDLCRALSLATPREGINETSIPGVRCLRFSTPTPHLKGEWPRSFVIVAQGQKEIEIDDRAHRYDQAYYLASPIDLQVTSRVRHATAAEPYLALLLSFDTGQVSELSKLMPSKGSGSVERPISHGLFSGLASDPMLEAAVRLSKLISNPTDAKILAPLVVREIYFHLLKSQTGEAIQQFLESGTRMHKIARAIQTIRQGKNEKINLEAIAKRASMSRTDFFRAFKEATAMSPIQYQKRLRLNEARRLIREDEETAESASFKVGYISASQFSREYQRLFGRSPTEDKREVRLQRAALRPGKI